MIQLLTVEIAGRTHRIASRPVVLTATSGPLLYRGGLPLLDIEERFEILSEGSVAEVSTDIMLPAAVAASLAQGHRLRSGRAEVAYLDEGATWEQRRIGISGYLVSGLIGAQDEPLRITIQGRSDTDDPLWPPASHVVGADTLDVLGALGWDRTFEGRGYPHVFGNPGYPNIRGTRTNIAATPAYPVASGAVIDCLVAGHIVDKRPAGTLYLMDLTAGTAETILAPNLLTDYDDLGQPITIAYATGAVQASWAAGNILGCSWIGAGGQVYRDTSLDRVGDLLRAVLVKTGQPIDWRRTEPVCRSLDWLVGGYWDQRVSAKDWLRNNLLSILPVSTVHGPQGIYLVRSDQPEEYRAIAHLRDGLGCSFTGRDSEKCEVIDRATLKYGLPIQGEHKMSYTLQAERPTGRGQGQTLPSVLRSSLRARTSWEQTSGIVWSDVTAGRILQAQLSARSPREVVSVECGASFNRLMFGDHVMLTSTRYGFDRRAAVVRSVIRRATGPLIEAVVYSRS